MSTTTISGKEELYYDPNRQGTIVVPELKDNGDNYHVLDQAIQMIKGVEGLTLEIGLRMGGGSKHIIDGLLANEDFNRTHIAIDPYGLMDYAFNETEIAPLAYSPAIMKKTMVAMYSYVRNKDIDFLFFPLEDTEFFKAFEAGVPTYNRGVKRVVNSYAFVYFDGPHTVADVMRETRFFMHERTPKGAIFVYDDCTGYYPHHIIDSHLNDNGWKPVIITESKIAYRKV